MWCLRCAYAGRSRHGSPVSTEWGVLCEECVEELQDIVTLTADVEYVHRCQKSQPVTRVDRGLRIPPPSQRRGRGRRTSE